MRDSSALHLLIEDRFSQSSFLFLAPLKFLSDVFKTFFSFFENNPDRFCVRGCLHFFWGGEGSWYRWGVGANTDFGTDFASPMLIHTTDFNGHILSKKNMLKKSLWNVIWSCENLIAFSSVHKFNTNQLVSLLVRLLPGNCPMISGYWHDVLWYER